MRTLSRRSFVAAAGVGLAAVPFPVWLEKQASAQAVTLTRYNIQTPAGQEMAAQYAIAVKALMGTAEGDPRSWTFWWYTHWVKGSTNKVAEIARLYPTPGDPRLALAQEAWNTCQPHGSGMDRMMFLPWHRMFVYFYERRLRSVLNNPSFTLPYWNYSPDSAFPFQREIPPQFRAASDPIYNALYRSSRVKAVNRGSPIDAGKEASMRLHLAPSFSETTFAPQGVILGFSNRLNGHVHGNVHTLVGNSLGLASVAWSGNDPLFWMHHSNIDRIWESWNMAGYANPTTTTWLDKSFVFPDEFGTRVVATVRDFVSPAALGYAYDGLETVPPPPPPPPPPTVVTAQAKVQAAPSPIIVAPIIVAVARRLTLRANPTRVVLYQTGAQGGTFAERIRQLPAGRRLYLVLEDLMAHSPPETVYDLFLNLPSGLSAQAAQAYRVGDVNFFEAVGHMGHSSSSSSNSDPASGSGPFFSYDITDVARALLAKGRIGRNAVVTVVPAGPPGPDARPEIGRLSIVEQ